MSIRAGARLLADGFSVLSMPTLAQHPELTRTAERDLAERARPGAFIYTVVWVVVATWYGLWETQRMFTAVNVAILVSLSVLRVAYHVCVTRRGGGSNSWMLVLTALILAGALHWGLLSAWIIGSADFGSIRLPFMIMLPAFAMGGTAVLGISRLIRQLYPCLVFTPSLVVCAVIGGRENNMLVVLAVCSLVYVLIASRTSSLDYWAAVRSAELASLRAEQLEILSITDPLTGVKNRLCFNNRIQHEWWKCAEKSQPLSAVLIDLDHFKGINDTYGHLAGDECLRQVAAALTAVVRDGDVDLIARYGGEEFVAILPGLDLVDASKVAERMVKTVAGLSIEYASTKIAVSCSAGVASTVPSVDDHSDALLGAADAALYDAKADGRNRMRIAASMR